MTAPARITQADMARATKAAAASGLPARVILDLEARKIEIVIDGELPAIPANDEQDWPDDDV